MGYAECAHCHRPLTRPVRGRPQTKFCSRNCKEHVRSAALSARLRTARAGRSCDQCGEPIAIDRNARARTCSKACGIALQNRLKSEEREARRQQVRPCHECGDQIPATRRDGSKFCSPACKKIATDRRWRERSPHYMRQYLYGITAEQYAAMLAEQDNRCAICRSPDWPGKDNRPHVDHDHETGAVRALLCGNCNNGIGMLGDDPVRLRAAAEYLEMSR